MCPVCLMSHFCVKSPVYLSSPVCLMYTVFLMSLVYRLLSALSLLSVFRFLSVLFVLSVSSILGLIFFLMSPVTVSCLTSSLLYLLWFVVFTPFPLHITIMISVLHPLNVLLALPNYDNTYCTYVCGWCNVVLNQSKNGFGV